MSDDEMNEEYEGSIEQMMVENGLLLHAVANLLVRKGVLSREELDAELDRLYEEIDSEDEGE